MVRFKMLGFDFNSNHIDRPPTSPSTQYRTWVVNNTPDFTGAQYSGEKSGTEPFIKVSAYAIFNPEPVDFSIPSPTDWSSTLRVLPANIYDSQLAIIDGYAYLFGGINSNIIYAASLNTPTEWADTGARLPTTLAGSQLAILDGYVWLFGGQTNASPTSVTNIVMSAPISNPLNWSFDGYALPKAVSHAQIGFSSTNIYLFGGYNNNGASNNILTAPISNPLAWTDTGQHLPVPLYGSQLAVADGYAFLLGGLSTGNSPTATIYGAHLNNLTNWFAVGNLPAPAFNGQFCTVGQQGYLFTPAVNSNSGTSIFTCSLANFATTWTDTGATIRGSISQSQLGVISDRVWLFGGNGNTVIFSCNSILKYDLNNPTVISYGNVTRTQFRAAFPSAQTNPLGMYNVLGFAYWKTDY